MNEKEIINIISDKILEVARIYNDVDNSDLQGISDVTAKEIYDLIKGEV